MTPQDETNLIEVVKTLLSTEYRREFEVYDGLRLHPWANSFNEWILAKFGEETAKTLRLNT